MNWSGSLVGGMQFVNVVDCSFHFIFAIFSLYKHKRLEYINNLANAYQSYPKIIPITKSRTHTIILVALFGLFFYLV